jgi:hypothetical protein
MSETNGQSRLDRIEEMIERSEGANEAAHERFEEEEKRLFTAQILMNGALQKLAGITELTGSSVSRGSSEFLNHRHPYESGRMVVTS